MTDYKKLLGCVLAGILGLSVLCGCASQKGAGMAMAEKALGEITVGEAAGLMVLLLEGEGIAAEVRIEDADGNGEDDLVISLPSYSGNCKKDDVLLTTVSGYLQGVADEAEAEFDKAVLKAGDCEWRATSADILACAAKSLDGENAETREFCTSGLWKMVE